MKNILRYFLFISSIILMNSCANTSISSHKQKQIDMTAEELLSNPDYLAISYGGYRKNSRDVQPSIPELKDDLKILFAMGVRILRTYNVHLPHAENILFAIEELKKENPEFEMYVMLGAWIDCENAWTGKEPNHWAESSRNVKEIEKAVALANQYPDIIKIIAVGNEAMVKWATAYYVQPGVILKWVNHLQDLKKKGVLDEDLWITSSDNFASWGGGEAQYHVEDLNRLIKAVDYISMHTYPMHDTHYNPVFWGTKPEESTLAKEEIIQKAMQRSLDYAKAQYDSVVNYMHGLGVDKPVHIGETGWAIFASELYGHHGAKATDEYKAGIYYQMMREWTQANNIACFYFEAFDEPWKDAANPQGSENHFGLFTVDGKAKYAVWDLIDQGTFKGLSRDGIKIQKTHNGNLQKILNDSPIPPIKNGLK